MKKSPRILTLGLLLAAGMPQVHATALTWDPGLTDNASSGGAGTWDTTTANWATGSSDVAWDNSGAGVATFGGTGGTVTLNSAVTVNQIKVTSTAYVIGAAAQTGTITFDGSYSSGNLAFDASGVTTGNITLGAKITGTITGGLVIKGVGANTDTVGGDRLFINNTNNNFIGDVIVEGGKLHMASANASADSLGNAANKIVLDGGALMGSGAQTVARTIQVNSNGGVISSADGGATTSVLNGAITGTGNPTYITGPPAPRPCAPSTAAWPGFSRTFEYRGTTIGTTANNAPDLATTASGGTWKITSGTVMITTAVNAFANGVGQGNLNMNGGVLNVNGHSETINGLDGLSPGSSVQNATGTSTLTLGNGDANGAYAGVLSNNIALTKIGLGIQTLTGANTHTGGTTITAGTLTTGNTAALGTGSVSVSGGVLQMGNGTVHTVSLGSAANLVINGGTLKLDSTFGYGDGRDHAFRRRQVHLDNRHARPERRLQFGRCRHLRLDSRRHGHCRHRRADHRRLQQRIGDREFLQR